MSKTIQGIYKPIFEEKYSAYSKTKRADPKNIIYRSSWERAFMKYCDMNKNILKWGSEETMIPYLNPLDGKVHRYFPDFWIMFKNGDQTAEAFIEIKPFHETIPPKNPRARSYKRGLETYAVNQAKWKYAREFCSSRGMEFIIITEKELFGKDVK